MQNYAVVIHEDLDGGFWGEVPALPGCYSQGETVDELKHNIREAIAGVLEILKEQGRERRTADRFGGSVEAIISIQNPASAK